MDPLAQQLTLKDTRILGYAVYGAPTGYPIVYCHGSQSSRLEMHYDMAFAADNNLRIITIDRPGHGFSDFNPNGSVLGFAQDVIQLLTHLNIDEFSVAGMSAGAPFALGLASTFPNKIHKVAIISGFAPYTDESKKHLSKEVKTMLNMAKSLPFILRLLLKLQAKQLQSNPKKALTGFLKIMSAPDQEILKNEAVMEVIEKMFTEAFKNGSKGVAFEISKLLVQDWGFKLENIKVPVTFWQGDKDNNVPHKWAELMAGAIENASLNTFNNEGHLILFNHAKKIFADLKG